MTTMKDTKVKNGIISSKMKKKAANATTNNWAGVLLRKTVSTHLHSQSGILFKITNDKKCTLSRLGTQLGNEYTYTGSWTTDSSIDVKIEMNDNTYKVYLNGSLTPAITAVDSMYHLAGFVSFINYAAAGTTTYVHIDDVKITYTLATAYVHHSKVNDEFGMVTFVFPPRCMYIPEEGIISVFLPLAHMIPAINM